MVRLCFWTPRIRVQPKKVDLGIFRLACLRSNDDRMARPKDDGAKSGHQLPLHVDDGACAPAFWTAWNTF